MKAKSAAAVLAVSMLVVSETIAVDDRKHIHAELRTESVAATASYMAALGRKLRSVMRKTENGVVGETFMYKLELPFAQTIQIIYHRNRGTDGRLCRCWQVRRISPGVCGEWTGKFASAMEAALDAQARPAILLH
jgi:hypothetical protein